MSLSKEAITRSAARQLTSVETHVDEVAALYAAWVDDQVDEGRALNALSSAADSSKRPSAVLVRASEIYAELPTEVPLSATFAGIAELGIRRNAGETARAIAAVPTLPNALDRPTITFTDSGGDSTGFTWANYQTALSRFVGVPSDNSTYGTRGNSVNNGGVSLTAEEFVYDGSEVRFHWKSLTASGGYWQVYVDGLPVSTVPFKATGTVSAGALKRINISFPTARARTIRIEYAEAQRYGFHYQTGKTMTAPTATRKKLIFMGDSYVGGALGISVHTTVAAMVERVTGLEVYNCGQGGSGYLSPGPSGQPYTDSARIAAAAAASPDYVIVFGSVNLGSGVTASDFQTAAAACYSGWASAAPAARLIVVGPANNAATSENAQRATSRDGIKAAALAAANVDAFLDPIGGQVTISGSVTGSGAPWVLGSGRVNAPNDSGNADYVIGTDAVHPTDAGHRNFAGRIGRVVNQVWGGYPLYVA